MWEKMFPKLSASASMKIGRLEVIFTSILLIPMSFSCLSVRWGWVWRSGFRECDDFRRYRTLRLLRHPKLRVRGAKDFPSLRGNGVRASGVHFVLFHRVQGFPESRFQGFC